MRSIKKPNKEILNIIKNSAYSKKIYIHMSTKAAGDDYDSYEGNYTNTNLNPVVIKGYVRELTSEAAYWKQYGLHQSGMKEILCESKYRSYFEKANKIVIDNITYQTFKEGTGSRTMIIARPFSMIEVVVSRMD